MIAQNEPLQFQFLNCRVTIDAGKAETPDGVSVLRLRTPFDHAPPVHVHHAEEEIFHITRGAARLQVGDRTFEARSGETVLAPLAFSADFVSPLRTAPTF